MTARSRNRALLAMAALATMWLLAAARIHVNASWSDGAWGYFALPVLGDPKVGDVVLFDPPEGIGAGVPYLKTVRGLPGARVQVGPARTRNGRPLATVAPGIVPSVHYVLHGPHRDSHDSRYAAIGFVPRDRIRARAVPLPDLPWLGLEGPLVGPEDRGP